MKLQKGFTLMELLIVIGILAILATAVVLVINPAQMLAQARDSQRISDLSSLKSAVAYYLATATTPALGAGPFCMNNSSACPMTGTCTVNSTLAVNGTGWVDVDLTGTSGGSSISSLPVDPTNSATYQYCYDADATNLVFELDANLESTKYADAYEGKDGGDNADWYEVGTSLVQ